MRLPSSPPSSSTMRRTARALIREYLNQHSDIKVLAECSNGFEAVKAAGDLKPDLLFLDIQMPKLDGFEVLDLIGRDAASVIFTTAYDEYALRAFNVHAVDYLLKPFGAERFDEALELARIRIRTRDCSANTRIAGYAPRGRRNRPGVDTRSLECACHPGGADRLRRSAGRLCIDPRGRTQLPEGTDAGRTRERNWRGRDFCASTAAIY